MRKPGSQRSHDPSARVDVFTAALGVSTVIDGERQAPAIRYRQAAGDMIVDGSVTTVDVRTRLSLLSKV